MNADIKSGKVSFAKYKPILILISYAFKISPVFIRRILWSFISTFNGRISAGLRYAILKAEAGAVGDNVYIGENVIIRNMKNLYIGDNVSIHPFCYLECSGALHIGNDVSIAHSSSIMTTSHTWSDHGIPIKYSPIERKEVLIGDDVWIGCGVRILYGVRVGDGVIIGANSLVRSDVPSMSIFAGVPARLVKLRSD